MQSVHKLFLIPAAISSVRISALPLFVLFYDEGAFLLCIALLCCAATTDLLDGYLARKLNATSRFGAYYDAATDYVLIMGIFTVFSAKGFYPAWLPVLITAAFVQFIISSLYGKKFFDPIGRYIGSALFFGIALTLLSPAQVTFSFVQYAFIGFFALSLGSRIVSFLKKGNEPQKLNL